jgi:hypothetical protein
MLLASNMVLKLVSAVSSRREVSILFNRVAIMILRNSSAVGAGIGIYNGLFHSTVITHSFDLFINIIGVIMLLFTPDFTVNLTDSFLLGGICPFISEFNYKLSVSSSYQPA